MATLNLEFMNFNTFTCISSRIQLDLPNQLWEARNFDPSGDLLGKLLHNKLYFLFDNYGRCYVSFFSPEIIAGIFTIIGVVLFFMGIFHLLRGGKYLVLLLLLLSPLPILFEFPTDPNLRVIPLLLVEFGIIVFGLWRLVKIVKSYWF